MEVRLRIQGVGCWRAPSLLCTYFVPYPYYIRFFGRMQEIPGELWYLWKNFRPPPGQKRRRKERWGGNSPRSPQPGSARPFVFAGGSPSLPREKGYQLSRWARTMAPKIRLVMPRSWRSSWRRNSLVASRLVWRSTGQGFFTTGSPARRTARGPRGGPPPACPRRLFRRLEGKSIERSRRKACIFVTVLLLLGQTAPRRAGSAGEQIMKGGIGQV